jgi:polar amino acid transport system substrate-binding protein
MQLSRHLALLFCVSFVLGALLLGCGCTTEQPSGSTPSTAIPPADTFGILTFYGESLPPYNYEENGILKGMSVDLLGGIAERMGDELYPEQVKIILWADAYQTVLDENNTVLFPTGRLPQREESFKWAGPLFTESDILFALPERQITIHDPSDLEGLRIGVITNHIVIQELLDAGVYPTQLVEENDVSVLVAKLQSGEIDLWGYPEAPGRYLTQQLTGNAYSFRKAYTFPPVPSYFAFNKNVPDTTVQAFQQALNGLKAEKDVTGISSYDRILGQYIPAIGFSQLTYLTEEFPPYNYMENGTVRGISIDILDAIFRKTVVKTPPDVHIVPLAEGFQAAQNGSSVLFSLARTPEREPLYKWAGPFTKSRFVVYALVSRNITILSATDLNQYRIGAVKTAVENDLLLAQGVTPSHIIPGATPEELLRMLEKGEIDLWAYGELGGRYLMLQKASDPNAYEVVYALSETDLYYLFSKDIPDLTVDTFGQALGTVRNQKDSQGVSDYERIIYHYLGVGCARQMFSDHDVMNLVNMTAVAIQKDAPGTFRHINAGEAPYRDPENPALYAFVYDSNVTMVAHADNILLVGENYRGKTDVTGKPFRDEIVAGALQNGTGWEEYVYINPVLPDLFYKTTYYRLTRGSDGNLYIVCSGNFKACET